MTDNPEAVARAPFPARHRWRNALLAGLVGGIVGTGVKTLCETVSPPRMPGEWSPLGKGIGVVMVALTGHDLPEPAQHMAENVVHWIFGASAGVVYALLAEEFTWVTIGYGAAFGVAFWVGFHELLLPLIGWSGTPAVMTFHEQINELISHILYGIALELTRRVIMKKLNRA